METILALSRRMAHSHSSPEMKYSPTKLSPTDSLKREAANKRIERRKPNWTEAENVFLLDQFGAHREILTCKATDASTNLKKQEIWRLICANLNAHNSLVRRTPAEVRRKWKNLVTAAKKEVWELRHQIHLNGGANGGANGRKISELSQRVLQLHSSGGFSAANPNGLYGTLLSAGLLAPAAGPGNGPIHHLNHQKYPQFREDKSFIPAHFTPIITLSESNNNNINLGEGPPSPLSDNEGDEDDESLNGAEYMSDSGIYEQEQEGIDLRVNVSSRHTPHPVTNGHGHGHAKLSDDEEEDEEEEVSLEDEAGDDSLNLIRFASQLGLRKNSQSWPNSNNESKVVSQINNNEKPKELSKLNGELLDASLKLRHHFLATLQDDALLGNLYRERLELQIAVLKLRKQKLRQELRAKPKLNTLLRKKKNPIEKKCNFNSYFRLKPKNTWMNFAARENQKLLEKGTNTENLNGMSNGHGD